MGITLRLMAAALIPTEVWEIVFSYAIDDERILSLEPVTSFSESAWTRTSSGQWILSSPKDTLVSDQKAVYSTIKAIVGTCKLWRNIGAEYLFRSLFFQDPKRLELLRSTLEKESMLGRWTKKLHLNFLSAPLASTKVEDAIVSVIKQCKNLEIAMLNRSLAPVFPRIADALCSYNRKSLRVVHWEVPGEALPKVIATLSGLPYLTSAHIDIARPTSEVHLGSTANLALRLRHLRHLSLSGFLEDFVEQAIGWTLPALTSLALDFGLERSDLPNVLELLKQHGLGLTSLDVTSIVPLNVPAALALCPSLTQLAFNPNWALDGSGGALGHASVERVGLHQLLSAFGVGLALGPEDPVSAQVVRRANDANFAMLTKDAFPRLRAVRALSRTLLRELNRADGPAEECYPRWEAWWRQCDRQGIRLEDCTGAELGTLPETEGESDESEEEEEDADGEMRPSNVWELRQLLEECRRMNATREAPMPMPLDFLQSQI
ncbi:hypothetical protein PUNSTDRAFT_113711 [Punctularia strigosozonata HHB-11173 SS5]|uniref:uncharacterized protein n=1 Tax=Punctularia strigosozonata (strain HHB-11173) TaxID=741275 RepID=UPI000441838F|nr:uncharacterized protein PUNSTDRAFT_113711 [Punctularia strigosozonata HHB-11173 SS5]EIN09311.1 hypothetical protein PUNSTDRAFT_113711 [Punctularia strigosozonata HHB-11173 SS5]